MDELKLDGAGDGTRIHDNLLGRLSDHFPASIISLIALFIEFGNNPTLRHTSESRGNMALTTDGTINIELSAEWLDRILQNGSEQMGNEIACVSDELPFPPE